MPVNLKLPSPDCDCEVSNSDKVSSNQSQSVEIASATRNGKDHHHQEALRTCISLSRLLKMLLYAGKLLCVDLNTEPTTTTTALHSRNISR